MSTLKTMRVEGKLVIIGANRDDVRAARDEAIALGLQQVSEVVPMGREWAVSLIDPDEARHKCEVVTMGLSTLIKGPSQVAVERQVRVMMATGHTVTAAPKRDANGVWIAVVGSIPDRPFVW